MRISHMNLQHDKDRDLCKFISSSMVNMVSKDNNNKTARGLRRSQYFEEQMISFMGENKRLLNIHEQKFVELAAFKANTIMFQANTNASLKNMET